MNRGKKLIFCMLIQIYESWKLLQSFSCVRGQKWPWCFNSWDPKICCILRTNLWIDLIFWLIYLIVMQKILVRTFKSSVIRQKGESQNGVSRKQSTPNFPKNEHFLSLDTHLLFWLWLSKTTTWVLNILNITAEFLKWNWTTGTYFGSYIDFHCGYSWLFTSLKSQLLFITVAMLNVRLVNLY